MNLTTVLCVSISVYPFIISHTNGLVSMYVPFFPGALLLGYSIYIFFSLTGSECRMSLMLGLLDICSVLHATGLIAFCFFLS